MKYRADFGGCMMRTMSAFGVSLHVLLVLKKPTT